MRNFRRAISLALWFAGCSLAQNQISYPERGVASRIAYAKVIDLLALPPLEEPEDRLVHPPLKTKDYSQLNPLDAISPALARALALGREAAVLPLVVSPSTPRMLTGFRGIPDEVSGTPPDTTGAVGPQHIMTTLNTNFQVQNRDGSVLWRMSFSQFFRSLGPFVTGLSDPRVIFDPVIGRWFVCAIADPELATSSIVLAVSQTNDPTKDWSQYRIQTDTPDQWFDYPTMALAGDWLIITTNTFRRDDYVRTRIHVFTKGDLLAGTAPFRTFSDGSGTLAPASGPITVSRVPIVGQSGQSSSGQGVLIVNELVGPPGQETFNARAGLIPVDDAWSSTGAFFADFGPQLGTSVKISTNDSRMQNCLVRGTSLWCTHHIFLPAASPNRALVQYYELNTTLRYSLVQRGRVDDPDTGTMYAYPSIAVNKDNDVLIGYSKFRADQYAAAGYSFRRGTDPPGQLQADTTLKFGEAPYVRSDRNRWGDYSNTLVDPVDDLSFWTVQEYAAATPFAGNRWGTWWGWITPVTQPCTFQLSSNDFPVSELAATVQVTVTTAPTCRWMAAANVGWMNVPANAGIGNGIANIQVEFNPFSGQRISTVTIAGQNVTIRQSGNAAPPPTRLSTFLLTSPTTGTAGDRIIVRVTVYNSSAIPSGRFRVGFYFATGNTIAATDPTSAEFCDFPSGVLPGTSNSCLQSITVPRTLLPGTFTFGAIADDRNETTMTDRASAIRVSDSGPLTIAAAANAPSFSASSVANGATTKAGAVSPGQNVVIYGARMGPTALVGLQLDSAGKVATALAGTRVFFDGVLAPIHYTSAGQVSVFVPYSVEGKSQTRVQIQYNDLGSAAVSLPVAEASPGLYALNFSGAGPGAIVNQDGVVNGANAPAARGSIVLIYATGHGPLNPPGVDGQVIGAPLPQLALQPVEVTIGGVPAAIAYAGPAPSTISGVLQINAVVPEVPPGNAVPVILKIGAFTAPAGITVAVK